MSYLEGEDCPSSNLKSILSWIARATVIQIVTYFIFGIIFFNVFNYAYLYSLPDVSAFLRPTTDPLVMAGPFLQLIRGPIIGLALYPVRNVFLKEKHGWLLLWGLMLGLMIFAPAGAAPGSIEGLIYTNIPLWFHVISLPETILQTLAFSWLLVAWQRHSEKKTD